TEASTAASDSVTRYSPPFTGNAARTEIYTLSLHDALPIFTADWAEDTALDYYAKLNNPIFEHFDVIAIASYFELTDKPSPTKGRSEEHTSELQSRENLVCRLLLEKKKKHTAMLQLTVMEVE